MEKENDNLLELLSFISSNCFEDSVPSIIKILRQLKKFQLTQESSNFEVLLYCLNRLVRGLSTDLHSVRHCFVIVLTEFLSNFPDISTSRYLELLDRKIEVLGKLKGYEKRYFYLGRIFGLAALLRSSRLNYLHQESLCSVFNQLLSIAQKKSYMAEISYSIIIDSLSRAEGKTFTNCLIPIIRESFSESFLNWSPEIFALALALQAKLKDNELKIIFGEDFLIFQRKKCSAMKTILLSCCEIDKSLHIAWQQVLLYFDNNKFGCLKFFKIFWNVVVDNGLFLSTHHRKFVGFQVAEKVINFLISANHKEEHSNLLEHLLSANLLKCLISSLMDQSAVLYNAARHLVQVLVNVPSYCALPCIRRFLGPHGHFYFDEVTKTTTVQQLLLKLDISSLESYLDFLFTSFIRVEGIESLTGEKNSRLVASKAFLSRRSTIKKMRGLLSLPLTVQKEVIIGKVVKFLSLYGNFTVNGKEPSLETLFPSETYVAAPIPPLCSETRFLCQSLAAYIFSNVSAWLHRPSKRNTKQKSTAGSFEHFSELLLVEHFRFNKQLFLLSLRRHSAVASLLDDQFATLFQSALELEHKLFVRQSLDSALSKRFRGLYLLLLHCGVLMLQEPHEYAGIVSDLLKCNEKFTTEDDAAGPGAAGVVVDIILSLLARPAVCIRPLCLEVFCCISPFLDGESLLHVVEVLEVDEKTFVNSRLQTSDIEQEESEEDNLCYERGVEEVDTVREHSQETAQEEMPDLTDEQMAQFDGALSLIFKQRKEIQQRKKETAALYAHLQLRVVELLNVYLQAQPTNPLLLRLIAPLLVGFRMCTKKTTGQANHLASLILLLLKKLFRSKKEALIMMAKGASEEIVSTLKRVVTLFDKTSEARVTGPSLEAIRFLLDLAKEHSQWPAKFATDLTVLYGVALKDFAGKRSTLYNSKFFEQYISQCPEFSVSFLYSCVDSLKISRNNYSSVRILEFIRALLNKKSKLKRSLVENGISSHCASLLGGLTDFISSFTSNFFPESKPPQKKYQANLKYFSLYLNHLLSILQHLKNLKAFESCKDIIIERLMTKIQFISDSYFCRDKPNVSTLCRQIKTILCDVSCVKRANVHSASGKRKKLTTDINTQLALAKRKLSN